MARQRIISHELSVEDIDRQREGEIVLCDVPEDGWRKVGKETTPAETEVASDSLRPNSSIIAEKKRSKFISHYAERLGGLAIDGQ